MVDYHLECSLVLSSQMDHGYLQGNFVFDYFGLLKVVEWVHFLFPDDFRAFGKLCNRTQIAKVGYNSTKKSYFYGPKIHMIVTKTGFLITYSITNLGVHDVKVLETLSEEANLPNILGTKDILAIKSMKSLPLRALLYPFRHVKTWINQKN